MDGFVLSQGVQGLIFWLHNNASLPLSGCRATPSVCLSADKISTRHSLTHIRRYLKHDAVPLGHANYRCTTITSVLKLLFLCVVGLLYSHCISDGWSYKCVRVEWSVFRCPVQSYSQHLISFPELLINGVSGHMILICSNPVRHQSHPGRERHMSLTPSAQKEPARSSTLREFNRLGRCCAVIILI